MRTLEKIGGFLLAAILLIALISGLTTGTGREAIGSILHAGRLVLGAFGDWLNGHAGGIGTAGHLSVALVVGLVFFAVLILLVPAARNGRGLAAAVFVCLLLSLLLFQPSIGTSLRDAVS